MPPKDVNEETQNVIQERKQAQIAQIKQEYESLAMHIPDEWGKSKEEKISLVKAIHTDILGLDRNNNARPLTDLKYFLFRAAKRNLDPFKDQVFAKYHWSSQLGKEALVIMSSIIGLRTIAQRTGRYAGSSKAEFTYDKDGKLESASTKVYGYNPKTMAREEVSEAEAYYDEYVQTKKNGEPNSFWQNKPRIMLSKCSEALALRKAFPDELSDVFVEEEIDKVIEVEEKPTKAKKEIKTFVKPEEPEKQDIPGEEE